MVLTHINPVRDRLRQSAVIRDENGLLALTFFAMARAAGFWWLPPATRRSRVSAR